MVAPSIIEKVLKWLKAFPKTSNKELSSTTAPYNCGWHGQKHTEYSSWLLCRWYKDMAVIKDCIRLNRA